MATHFSRARKGEPGGPEMRFAGAPSWDSAAREKTIAFDVALLSTVQNRCGRQKVSFNRSAAVPRNGGRNGHPVTTNHLLCPNERRSLRSCYRFGDRFQAFSAVSVAKKRTRPGGGQPNIAAAMALIQKRTRNFCAIRRSSQLP